MNAPRNVAVYHEEIFEKIRAERVDEAKSSDGREDIGGRCFVIGDGGASKSRSNKSSLALTGVLSSTMSLSPSFHNFQSSSNQFLRLYVKAAVASISKSEESSMVRTQ